ncbi:cap-specific mRNA (nucleoside-2'-O-)-methyltransferase 1 [Colletes gigas]|uniref:cap-specific mRNA (nucleoside-2'-O-)-methyltransferase 1 n=1 Tax=Colletes gigas TaxID=935657 RepID=UPI001C9B0105|nr:cap-specific mRNA (nucleoside-2'-O-)-methyltransferase 1 [Colletes gigas]XP_043251109.1 cap-specific mRNA (nucleoside-2'-O-)-methyltransferase 1 [Colletes gigas]XP_043251110.1 cap-specific mRNA (nucleoside-2'-O-)-methyltransferase 1 [Colletes gigas]
MKSNSDESDYEDKNFSSQNDYQTMEGKEAYPSYFSDQSCDERRSKKRKHDASVDESSDLSDYYDTFDEKDNAKFSSHNMYQDMSGEQDSGDDFSSLKNIETKHTDDRVSNSNDDAKESNVSQSVYEESYHRYNKRREIRKTRLTDDDTTDEDKSNDTKEQSIKRESTNVFDGQDKVQRMMRKMGYEEGYGLGKNKQGRLEPVQTSKQHGRRGLGHHVPELEASSLKWNPAEEKIEVQEHMEWLASQNIELPTREKLETWLQLGPKKVSIDGETLFCSRDIVTNIINSKTVFNNLDRVEMRRARTRSNPYETIRGSIFLNRAAVKMANMDSACNFMFTNPQGLQNNELLYFADVCAGPGGFSEYVLWKKKWHAKGFGFTLKNENDFKLDDFYAGPCETFHPYYGPKENGDVYDPSNQDAFRELIMTHTNGKGVHFMMSDGGFSVEGQENVQEILSKQLYLCQCLVALMIVREKGHFVTKLFDIFTPFSAGLVYLMYHCFEKICIFKPNSSRPANSERYLICKKKRPGTEIITQYLKHINHLILTKDENNDVLQLVQFEELEREQRFLQYLRESNNSLGKKQIIGLRKIAAFCENSTLVEVTQADMRKECLKYWKLPEEGRTIPRHMKPQDKVKTLLKNVTKFLSKSATKLTVDNKTILNVPYNWFCVPCGTGGPYDDPNKNATFYLGMGRSKVYRYVRGSWMHVDDISLELPPDTLIYAEVVYEKRKESKQLQKVLALHIIDAFYLGNEDVSHRYLRDRHKLARKFCEALWKPDGNKYARIRTKELILVNQNIDDKLQVKQRIMKNNLQASVYEFAEMPLEGHSPPNEKPYFILNSIMFLKNTAAPWNRHGSKTYRITYLYNPETRNTSFDRTRPTSAEAGFIETFENRVIWYWPNDKKLTMEMVASSIKQKCSEVDLRSIDY